MSEVNNDLLLEKLDSIKRETAEIKSEAKDSRKETNEAIFRLESKVDNNFASKERVNNLEIRVTNIETSAVTKPDFQPVKSIVYGLVGLILIAVIGAILALVIIK